MKRLLDSIAIQNFRDFVVIITDDSPNDDIRELCVQYERKFNLRYHKNKNALGTPENWNESIRLANGQWIKLMHDDDWFSGPESLGYYHRAIMTNPTASFIFSAYQNIFFEKNTKESVFISDYRFRHLSKNLTTLFSSNVIGPPSVVIHRNDKRHFYDNRLKWLVDIDFYIRYLQGDKPIFIKKSLVNVGIGKEQVTQDCFRLRQVEIPEGFYLLYKTGTFNLKNILVYDAWWRMMRNLEVRKKEDITGSGYAGDIPPVILSMIRWQRKFPLPVLRVGVISKLLMGLHYIFNKRRIGRDVKQ